MKKALLIISIILFVGSIGTFLYKTNNAIVSLTEYVTLLMCCIASFFFFAICFIGTASIQKK